MSVTVTASYSNGQLTLSGTKPDGQGTVTVKIDGQDFGSKTSNDKSWSIGPIDHASGGPYNCEARLDNDRLVTFTLSVNGAPPHVASVAIVNSMDL